MPRRNNGAKYVRQIFVRNCDSKRQYKNEREAKQTAEYQMLIHQNLELSVYKCDMCNYWHLTSAGSKSTEKSN